jgi:hypothetical protein
MIANAVVSEFIIVLFSTTVSIRYDRGASRRGWVKSLFQ